MLIPDDTPPDCLKTGHSFELLLWLAPIVLLAVFTIAFLLVTQNFVTQNNELEISISQNDQANLSPGSPPEPITNNAVAEFTQNGVQYLMSFMGLGPGKLHEDISKKAWLWRSDTATWEPQVMSHPAWCCSPAGRAGPIISMASVTMGCPQNRKTASSPGTQQQLRGCAFRKHRASPPWITAAC